MRRFSHVSTVAVAGKRQDEVVTEDNSIDWNRSDYDPYARTKKFCEHMIRQLLPEVPKTIFRPSIVLGDSRRAETTQFDMVRAFVFLAGLPVLPLRSKDRVDIVNVDFVADAVATLHVKEKTQFDTYHLSSGRESQTFRQLTESLAAAQDKRGPFYLPFLQEPFTSSVNALSNRKSAIGRGAALMKVFMPYLTFNTVFDNTRVTTELGRRPVPFSQYSYPLLKFSRETNFTYPYRVACSGWRLRRMMDFVLEAWVSGNIERAKAGWILGKGESWQPGKKLKLLFAGYNGTRNTGSDVRPEETLRQLRHILGADNVEFSAMSQNFDMTRGYFAGAEQVHLPDVFPPFLAREIPKHHGVVVVRRLGLQKQVRQRAHHDDYWIVRNRGGAEQTGCRLRLRGRTHGSAVAKMCGRYCKDSLIITRNEESRTVLRKLGVPTEFGTDTAWTFEPLPPEYGRKALTDAGWDGKLPVLIVCPINPFWWPVKPSLVKYAARTATGAYKDSHFRTVYFHKSGRDVDAAFERYLTAIANAMDAFRQRHRVFPILVATEALDVRACRRISEKLGGAVPVFTSEEYDMYQMVSILRAGNLMASSRFHGIVTSMPALVPSAGITMDERIRNLMRERGHEDLLMNVDDPDLEPKLLTALEKLADRRRKNRRRNRPHRSEESENDGAHGRVLRGRSAAPLSGVSCSQRPVGMGGLPASDGRRVAAADRNVQLNRIA